MPCQRPGRHGTLANGQVRVRHHQRFGDFIDPPQTMTIRAGALRRVRRKVFGVQHRLPRRVTAGAGIEHADQARQRSDTAHRGARARRAPLLLQGHGGRQAFDGIDIRHSDLIDQPPRVWRDRFEVAALGFGIQSGKRQGRLARPGHAGEHHQRIAGDVDVNVLQVVLTGAAHANHAGGCFGGAF